LVTVTKLGSLEGSLVILVAQKQITQTNLPAFPGRYVLLVGRWLVDLKALSLLVVQRIESRKSSS
jgi:hypothetical protein